MRLIRKGGPGSGNFGHSGRPGKRGGSMPGGRVAFPSMPRGDTPVDVSTLKVGVTRVKNVMVIPVTPEPYGMSRTSFRNVIKRLHDYPDGVLSTLEEVHVHAEPGPIMDVGGVPSRIAGFYNGGDYIQMYDCELYKESEGINYVLDHEMGHSVYADWYNKANMDYRGVNKHPDFDYSPYESTWKAFQDAWKSGEDGISDYSKVWAKEGKDTETFAELFRVYMNKGRSGLLSTCRKSDSLNLGRAFLDVMELYGGDK